MRLERRPKQPIGVEARWFIDSDVGAELIDDRLQSKHRIDTYHLDSLSESAAWKRRGRRGPLEHKQRIGDPTIVIVQGVTGVAERWLKERRGPLSKPPGEWLAVIK